MQSPKLEQDLIIKMGEYIAGETYLMGLSDKSSELLEETKVYLEGYGIDVPKSILSALEGIWSGNEEQSNTTEIFRLKDPKITIRLYFMSEERHADTVHQVMIDCVNGVLLKFNQKAEPHQISIGETKKKSFFIRGPYEYKGDVEFNLTLSLLAPSKEDLIKCLDDTCESIRMKLLKESDISECVVGFNLDDLDIFKEEE